MKKTILMLVVLGLIVGCATFSFSHYMLSKRESCETMSNREFPKIIAEKKCFQIIGPKLLASENGQPLSAVLFPVCAEDVFAFLLTNEGDKKLLELNLKQSERKIGECKVEEEDGKPMPFTILLVPMNVE